MATFLSITGVRSALSQEEKDFRGLNYDYTRKLAPVPGYDQYQQTFCSSDIGGKIVEGFKNFNVKDGST